jgi:hypothetical protein
MRSVPDRLEQLRHESGNSPVNQRFRVRAVVYFEYDGIVARIQTGCNKTYMEITQHQSEVQRYS